MKQIGSLFPLGGPVPPDLVIGREGVIADVEQRMREGLSTMLVGPRRIGKTTVCEAVCANLADDHIVVRVEVPERAEPRELLQLIIDRCATLSLIDDVKRAAGVVKPLIERLLGHENIPLDLSGLINAPASELPVREVLRLPLELARDGANHCGTASRRLGWSCPTSTWRLCSPEAWRSPTARWRRAATPR
jgi:hypothetical protein